MTRLALHLLVQQIVQESMDLERVVAKCADVARRVLDRLNDVVYLVSGVKCETEDANDVGHEGWRIVGRRRLE